MRRIRWLFAMFAAMALPVTAFAQEPVTIHGRVTDAQGRPVANASVGIPEMSRSTTTDAQGNYTLTLPGARIAAGQTVQISASSGTTVPQTLSITLRPGANLTQDITLGAVQVGELVITGAGTTQTVAALGNVRNQVTAEEIQRSNEPNVVEALAGKAPNVEVTQTSGEPGASAYIRIRGTRTLSGNGQPLFVVDGVPVDNSSFSTTNFNPVDGLNSGEIEGTAQSNRMADLNPNDIENIEILKGAAAGAIYGARAGQGVVLITTRSGRAGPTRYSLHTSYTNDDVSRDYPLQTTYGQGRFGVSPLPCESAGKSACNRSWGPALPTGTQTYDHATEAFVTGHTTDNTLTISGGNERTLFYLSGGYLHDRGVFAGPNNRFQRASVRLKATQALTNNLRIGGNFAYSDTRGNYVQRGNNTNGLLLGLLRSPPEWNNLPYLDPNSGLHRSFRLQHPTAAQVTTDRGFANPFFVLYQNVNTQQVGRFFGNVNADFDPLAWLQLHYTLGTDYYADERVEGAPQGMTGAEAAGRVTTGKIVNYNFDSNLTATADHQFSDNLAATLTLGQNLNSRTTRILADVGRTLLAPQPFKLSNTLVRDIPIDDDTVINGESYFGQGTLDLWNQLYLTAALRNDGSTTFDRAHRRSWFPKASASWNFTRTIGESGLLPLGKFRIAYGETGQEPGAYLTSQTYTTGAVTAITQGVGMTPTIGGLPGLNTNFQKAASTLKPERTKEFETGFDLQLLRNLADFSFTYYNARTEDVILTLPLAPSSGFTQTPAQGAKFRNRGLELALNVRPVNTQRFAWDMGFQWARNRSTVLDLEGADFVELDPQYIVPHAVAMKGKPIGVFRDFGWVRCGLSPTGKGAAIEGVDLATICAGQPTGAVYIGADGFPVGDDNARIIGDPNPKWTGSVRSGFTYGAWELSGLLDIRHGGQIFNGTKGALYSYGTHKDTEQRATCGSDGTCTGNMKTFGTDFYPGPVVGPGAGKAVPIGENWYRLGLGTTFSGYDEAFMEDGGYTKLRELSLGYTVSARWLQRNTGLSSMNIRLAGRNLKTWTKYTGFDPETNLGQAVGRTRGVDYFNMPQTRSWVLTVDLNR